MYVSTLHNHFQINMFVRFLQNENLPELQYVKI
jgi:hypothetical protein